MSRTMGPSDVAASGVERLFNGLARRFAHSGGDLPHTTAPPRAPTSRELYIDCGDYIQEGRRFRRCDYGHRRQAGQLALCAGKIG